MAINRTFFFDHARQHLFDGRLRQSQVEGLTVVLDEWESRMAAEDDRWLAYMLATTHHETGRTMQPVRETFADSDDKAIAILDRAFAAGRLRHVSRPYWRRDGDGKSWLGRGFVQLTHKSNYEAMAGIAGLPLLDDPNLAMDTGAATKILFAGMTRGSFTGKKLAHFFEGEKEDWVKARRIINGLDRAELVASYGRAYYAAISHTV